MAVKLTWEVKVVAKARMNAVGSALVKDYWVHGPGLIEVDYIGLLD